MNAKLRHANGCTLTFAKDDDGRVTILSERPGRETISFGPVGAELARLWYRGWMKEGFEPV